MDFWDIVDGSEKTSSSNVDFKVKKVMFIIGLNLADNQCAYIKSCKGYAKAWKTLCNIYETKNFSNILFDYIKFIKCKM